MFNIKINIYLGIFFTIFCLIFLYSNLASFPPYFYCDEAIHSLDAYSILSRGADIRGEPFPIFFQGFGQYNLSLTVYTNVIFIKLFGLSLIAVRMQAVFFSLLSCWMLFLILLFQFRIRFAWIVFPLMTLTPSWYLHSRTGFECLPAAAWFLCFLYCYLNSKEVPIKNAFLCSFFAAACFYSYTSARGWILVSLLILIIFNLKIHLKNWKSTLVFILIFCLLMSPLILFVKAHPWGLFARYNSVSQWSYNTHGISELLTSIYNGIIYTLNPRFLLNEDLFKHGEGFMQRHFVPGMSHVSKYVLVFFPLGLVVLLRNIKNFAYRSILLVVFAVIIPVCITNITINRILVLVPLLIMISIIGLDLIISSSSKFISYRITTVALVGLFITLLFQFHNNIFYSANANYQDYGRHGLQFGAHEVSTFINKQQEPFKTVLIENDLFDEDWAILQVLLTKKSFDKVIRFSNGYECMEDVTPALLVARANSLKNQEMRNCSLSKKYYEIKDPNGSVQFKIQELSFLAGLNSSKGSISDIDLE